MRGCTCRASGSYSNILRLPFLCTATTELPSPSSEPFFVSFLYAKCRTLEFLQVIFISQNCNIPSTANTSGPDVSIEENCSTARAKCELFAPPQLFGPLPSVTRILQPVPRFFECCNRVSTRLNLQLNWNYCNHVLGQKVQWKRTLADVRSRTPCSTVLPLLLEHCHSNNDKRALK